MLMRELSYDPLWKKLVELKLSKGDLAIKAEISKNTVTKMFKNEYVSLEVLVKICRALDCDIVDLVSCLPKVSNDTAHASAGNGSEGEKQ